MIEPPQLMERKRRGSTGWLSESGRGRSGGRWSSRSRLTAEGGGGGGGWQAWRRSMELAVRLQAQTVVWVGGQKSGGHVLDRGEIFVCFFWGGAVGGGLSFICSELSRPSLAQKKSSLGKSLKGKNIVLRYLAPHLFSFLFFLFWPCVYGCVCACACIVRVYVRGMGQMGGVRGRKWARRQ